MSTCRCCGQHIDAAAPTAPVSQVVRVGDAVLELCNTAFEQARTRGHVHVEIAHAALAVAMSEAGARSLSGQGLDAQRVGQAADAWLGKWAQMRNEGAALTTSSELKQVLHAAENMAQRAGRTHASLEDFIAALLAKAECLWPASFWRARSTRHDTMRAAGYEGPDARASGGMRGTVELASGEAMRGGTGRATASADVTQQSLLDREYAWLRDMKRTQASGTTGRVVTANAALISQNTSATTAAASSGRASPAAVDAAVSSQSAAEQRVRGDRERDARNTPPGGARVTRLFATAPSARVSDARAETPPAPVREDQFTRSILQRLDMQERTLTQRLDMQQRMIAEMAEAFARSMRELAQARSEAAAAFARAVTQDARTRTGGDSADDGERASGGGEGSRSSSHSRSGRSGSRHSRGARGSWRRQSWSSWRSRQRRDEGHSSSEHDGARSSLASSQWLDRAREPRKERAPSRDFEPRETIAPLSPTAAQFFDAAPIEQDAGESNEREKRFYLALDDDIEKAPSIGPRTAGQLNGVGLMTVRDLLRCDPSAVAARLQSRFITADRLTQWQAQSRLVCSVPWLRGTHAQLLAGAGFDTIEKIVAADVPSVCAAILKFAATRDGMSVLRSSLPPGEDWVIKRLEHARAAEPERAVA